MADPAFRGFVESTLDALLVFEGCKRGYLPKISRRLQDYEKKALVVSGAIFVFDEEETGIKRWTDGLSWSPSRTLGNFLVYRELDKKSSTSANKEEEEEIHFDRNSSGSNAASRLMGGLTSKSDPLDDANDLAPVPSTSNSNGRTSNVASRQRSLSEVAGVLQMDRARERALVGSLTSSYRFRSDGLVKKTISLSGLHLVAYYRLEDVTSGRLRTPSSHTELMALEVSPGFLTPSLFRVPPVVEVGLDGQIRYKGESDAPISPLTRSGSSQGFPTPNLNSSRPASSDPYSSTTPSQFTPLLGARPPSRDYPQAPGSPRRGATATVRSTNRFDPYSVGRYSPNATSYASANAYPFNHQVPPSQPSPNRSTFSPIGEIPTEYQRRDSSGDRRPSGQSTGERSGEHAAQGPWYGQNLEYQPGPSGRSGGSFGAEASTNYYQPRHPTPYAPLSEPTSSAAVFAYQPPSTAPPARRASEGVPSPLGGCYPQQMPQTTTVSRPVSQQYQPTASQYPSTSNPHSFQPTRSASAYSQLAPGGVANNPSYDSPPVSAHQRRLRPSHDGLAPSTTAWNPTTTPQPAQAGLLSGVEMRGAYATTSLPGASGSTYSYDQSHQPNGLVAGFTDKQHPVVHGLGVSETRGPPALGLYDMDARYDRQQHSDTGPLDYRGNPSYAAPSALPNHPAYPPDSAASSTPVMIEHLVQYSAAAQSNDQAEWRQHPKRPRENGNHDMQVGAGWWSPGTQENTSASFWQGQGMPKKEYS